ncbi:MAG: PAS domain S-box protein [Caldilineaceae bacterium]
MTSQSEHTGQQAPTPFQSVGPDAPIPVVGIGADAGGRAALQRFFAHLAEHTGMAFVIILRGSGGKQSFTKRLQSFTSLPVHLLTGDTPLEPDHVYLAPLQHTLTLVNNLLHLGESLPPHKRHTPIDGFLQSLSSARGADAIGLLLSGKGNDGLEGLKAIQAQGGLTLVQAPQEAQYPALPRQAVDLALTNGVGAASELAQRLNARERVFNLAKMATTEEETAFAERNDEMLNAILTQLHIQTGYDLSYYKRSTILRRIARRLQIHSLATLAAYAAFLRQHPEEVQALFKDCLIAVTNFFRDPEEFNWFEKEIIPKLVANKTANDTIRIWTPGCATGEEAYSLAILLHERLVPLAEAPRLQIFATDIDEEAIATARRGLYPKSIAKDVAPARLQRFFTEESNGYRVKVELRETVLFAIHNLLKDPPFAKLDLISCRNLLIYFNRDVQSKALALFHYALNRNGYLFLGTAESIDTADELFALLDKRHHLFQRRTGVTPQRSSAPSLFASLEAKALGPMPRQAKQPTASIEELYQQWTLRRYAPPRVLVNEHYEVTHFFNGADRYLREREGAVTQNILQKVLPELRLDLRTALYHAVNKGERTASRLLRVLVNNETCFIQLHVGPIQEPGFPRGYFEVVFEERQEPAVVGLPPSESAVAADNALTSRLEEELLRTRERLQMVLEEHETSNQELKIANEELQSINEELKSTTEELETSKEELQSMNEELSTLNHELKLKIDELSRANSDLLNLIVSTDVGALFLDLGMRIKRFTPRVAELFNIIESDVGRPLSHISHKIRHDVHPVRLLELAARVLSTLEQSEEVIQSEAERWYMMRMFPYRTVENTVDGVVITFVDITALKRAEHEIKQRIQQQTVAELGRQALQGDDPTTLMTVAMERATAVLDMEFAKVLEMQADGATLLYKAGLGWSAVATNETTILTTGNSQSWYTFHEDQPIVVENIKDEKRFQLSPLLSAHHVASGITVAIPGRTLLYGVFGIYSQQPRSFTSYEVAFLQAIANVLGEAIERKRIEQQLREREAILSTLGDNLPSGAIYQFVQATDGRSYYNYISNSIEALLGLPAATILHDAATLHATYQAEDLAQRQQRLEASRIQLTRYELEALRRLPNGEARWVYERGQPRRLPNGATAWGGIYLDVTARKAAQGVLERYQLLAQQTRDMIFFVRPNGEIIEANQGAVTAYGYAYPTLLTKSMRELRDPAFLDSLETDLAQANSTGLLFETRHRRADGSTFPVEISARGAEIGGERLILSVVRDITERKQAEEQLRYHAHLLEQIEDAVIATDTELRVTAWNRGAEKLYGWQAHEVLGQPLNKIMQSSLTNEQRTQLLQEVDASSRYTMEVNYHRHKDGAQLQLEANTVALYTANGQVTGYLSINRDISERKRAEAALRQSEARYRELANAMPQIVYTTRPDGRADFTNQQWYAYTGIDVNASLAFEWTHSLHPEDREQALARWQASVQTGAPYETEYRLQGKDGKYCWFLARAVPIRDETGQITKWIGNSTNIHAQKQTEEALRASAANFRAALEHASDAIFIATDDRVYVEVNAAACELSGYRREELIGKHVEDLTPPAAYQRLDEDRRQLLAGRSQVSEWGLLRKDGKIVPIEVNAKQLPDGRWQAIVRDITERKQNEQALKALNDTLEQRVKERTAELERRTQELLYRNRELDQFAYVASHDLRSPLRAIDHLSSWIMQDAGESLPPASLDHLHKLRGRVKRLERLLDDLLAYSRADRYQYPVEQVDTQALVEDIVRMVALPEGFTVTMPSAMPVLLTERVPLELVLRNLINNAIKHHNRQDGRIQVIACEVDDFIEFTITDDGPGIAAEFHERIFQMFQTLKPRDAVEGSGMGLAIVKKVVESRGGKITVESNAEQGAAFRFTWSRT